MWLSVTSCTISFKYFVYNYLIISSTSYSYINLCSCICMCASISQKEKLLQISVVNLMGGSLNLWLLNTQTTACRAIISKRYAGVVLFLTQVPSLASRSSWDLHVLRARNERKACIVNAKSIRVAFIIERGYRPSHLPDTPFWFSWHASYH